MKVISRQEAKAVGLKRYFTGEPCKHGHVDERFTSTRWCCACALAANRSLEKKAYFRVKNAEWAAANPERKKAHKKRRSNRLAAEGRLTEVASEYCRRWRHKNPGKVRAAAMKRHASKLQATPPWADKEKIAEMYKRATEQQEKYGKPVHVDHIVPLRGKNVCGLHVHYNLQLMFGEDNVRKSNHYDVGAF